jgi:hypothetical protein
LLTPAAGHGLPSAVQLGPDPWTATHRPTPPSAPEQFWLQQSAPVVQMSLSAWQVNWCAQKPFWQSCEQQSVGSAHASPIT